MVLTRSQTTEIIQEEIENMEFSIDNENDISVPERNSRDTSSYLDRANFPDLEQDHEGIRYDQTFTKMNNRIDIDS